MLQKIYKQTDIFSESEEDDSITMVIPPEICKELNWYPGDTIKIIIEEGSIKLTKDE